MECAARGRVRTRCTGAPTRRCGQCGAVSYCSLSHQISHWNDHKEDCTRLEQQMRRADALHDFPFIFSMEATLQTLTIRTLRATRKSTQKRVLKAKIRRITFLRFDFFVCAKQVTRCSFLMARGLHQRGMWKSECGCGPSVASSDNSRIEDDWNLPSALCPCSEPISPISMHLSSWKDYYQWRCLPLHSPAALLLHWPLTIYQGIQLAGFQSSSSGFSNELHLHYLGPDKELLQLSVFGELHALFPGLQLHIELVGPEVPELRDGERINLHSYAHCSEKGCSCKSQHENASRGVLDGGTSVVTLQLRRGFYHERYRDIVKDSFPHFVIAPNAGIAAYSSWLPTIELIKDIGVPAIFSDYCEEAAHLAACCISTVIGHPLAIPIQINPFRQPMVVEDSALHLPCFSNCFLLCM